MKTTTTTPMPNTYQAVSDYSLRSFKKSEFASHETLCFQAKIVRGRKAICTVENDGQGGPDHFRFTSPEAQAEFAAVAHELRDKEFIAELDAMHPDAPKSNHASYEQESLVQTLVAEHEAFKHAKKWFTFIPAGGSISGYGYLTAGRKKVPADHPVLTPEFIIERLDGGLLVTVN